MNDHYFKVFALAIALAFLATRCHAASFPYIRLNAQTNRISDNGTALTFNGTPLSGGNWSASGTTNSTLTGNATVNNIVVPPVAATQSGTNLVVNFASGGFQTVTASADLYVTAIGMAPGVSIALKIYPGGSTRNIVWDPSITQIGSTLPSTIAASKILRVNLDSDGTSITNVNAWAAVQP